METKLVYTSPMAESTDEELARLVQGGDHDALATLMERYTGKLMRYGRRFLSSDDHIDDAVQDVFVTVYENIRDFDSTRKFSSWIYRIAHNAFVDLLRKQARGPVFLEDFDRIIPHPLYEDPDEAEKEKAEMRVLVEKGLKGLSPAYREIIDLYYFEDFNYREIADILHIPLGTVGIRLSRARQALKKQFPKNI